MKTIETHGHFIGFGLCQWKVMEIIKRFDDPYPYSRLMIAEVGMAHKELPHQQRRHKRGITKNNFYTHWDVAMPGITSLSKVPLRTANFAGMLFSVLRLLSGLFYLVYKLIFRQRFSLRNDASRDWDVFRGLRYSSSLSGMLGRVHKFAASPCSKVLLDDRE